MLADEPRYGSSLEAQLRQSLLRGAGLIVNRAPILIAENTRDTAQYTFQQTVMRVVTDVELRYFDLLLARENLRVARKSLEVLVGLRKQTQALVRAGQDPKVKLVQADANVQNSELQIIVRENAVRDAEDQLKNLIDPTNGKLLDDVELIPSESLGDEISEAMADLPSQIQSALAKRPELLGARAGLNSSHLRVITAKNGMLPLLDITGTLGYEGGGVSPHDSWRELGEFRFFTWSFGLTLEIPLGNRSARAALEQAKLRRDQAKAQLARLERNIVVEVRRAYRGVATARKRIRSAAALLGAREDQFKAEQARYRAGDQVTLFELSRFNEDRIQAETDLVAARIDLLQALARLRQAAASTLDKLERRGLLMAGSDRLPHPAKGE